MSYLHYQYQHCDSKPNLPGISLLLPKNIMENIWNLVSPEKWEPWSCYPHSISDVTEACASHLEYFAQLNATKEL